MSVQTYSPGDVALSIGGNIISGFAEGTFINVERNKDAMTLHVGADGEASRTRSSDRSAMLALTLKQTSAGNRILGAYALLDEKDGSGTFDVQLTDNLGNKIFASDGWVKKVPAQGYGDEQTNREWQIDLAKITQEWPAA